ncbi:5217_t:CDS:2, partial [Rhizophagus irregularis]
MNCLIKEGTSSTLSLCNLHNQTQKLLDNEAQWSCHNTYLQSLSTNQTPSIIEPIFPKAKLISKEMIKTIK